MFHQDAWTFAWKRKGPTRARAKARRERAKARASEIIIIWMQSVKVTVARPKGCPMVPRVSFQAVAQKKMFHHSFWIGCWVFCVWLFVGFWGGCCLLFGCVLSCQSRLGPPSLSWLCWDQQDCRCRHDERSKRSKKKYLRELPGISLPLF